MKNLLLFVLLLMASCSQNSLISNIDCSQEGCGMLNPFSFSATPDEESLIVSYGQSIIICGTEKTCIPDALDFYISEDNQEFSAIRTVDPIRGSFVIGDLENGKDYFIKMVNVHCELPPIETPAIAITPGAIELPTFIDQPIVNTSFDNFRLAPNGDDFIVVKHSYEWFLSSFSNPEKEEKVFQGAFHAQWNPVNESEVAFIEHVKIYIEDDFKGMVPATLKTVDLQTGIEKTIHTIPPPYDYTISQIQYAIDGQTIYFMSNKENGTSSEEDNNTFNNLWEVNLLTGEMKKLSDFFPQEFRLADFVIDPKQSNNLYLIGADVNDNSGDLYAYHINDQSLSPIVIDESRKSYLSIDPTGNSLVFTSNKTGTEEMYSYHLQTKLLKQITNRLAYYPSRQWDNLNWTSDTEFITNLKVEQEEKLAIFKI